MELRPAQPDKREVAYKLQRPPYTPEGTLNAKMVLLAVVAHMPRLLLRQLLLVHLIHGVLVILKQTLRLELATVLRLVAVAQVHVQDPQLQAVIPTSVLTKETSVTRINMVKTMDSLQ